MERKGPGGSVALSGRLRMLADMVTPGSRLVDVGCDHGFLSIYLVQEGACPTVLAMDVREGPLAAAKRHVEAYGLGEYITLRLSDGLGAYRAGEAEALVCAGMGGRLMERILREGMDLAWGMREVILQPQSEIPQFRAFLREAGFGIVQEDAIREDGKYYFAMKARPGAGDSGGRGTAGPPAAPAGLRPPAGGPPASPGSTGRSRGGQTRSSISSDSLLCVFRARRRGKALTGGGP